MDAEFRDDIPMDFYDYCGEVAATLEDKAMAYGNSFQQTGEFIKLLYPSGIPVEAYDDALTMVRMYDKMKRIANNPGRADPGGEDPFHDIAGYAVLAKIRRLG